jgi:hypothetical protein
MSQTPMDEGFRLSIRTSEKNRLNLTLNRKTCKRIVAWSAGFGAVGAVISVGVTYVHHQVNVNQTTIHMPPSPPVGIGEQKK